MNLIKFRCYQSKWKLDLGLGNSIVDLNKWNHIAASYDGNSVQLYLNGVADGSFTKMEI